MNNTELREIIDSFGIEFEITPFGEGHINDTYITNTEPQYVLQRINHKVFPDPVAVMNNIMAVTGHIKNKLKESGIDSKRRVIDYLPDKNGNYCLKTSEGNYFRLYECITGASTYQVVDNPIKLYSAAKAFGKFQNLLADFPAEQLVEIIPDFHNTKKRYEALMQSIDEDPLGRVKDLSAEIAFVKERETDARLVVDAIEANEIPLRVTHNDTKINNVLIDDETGEGICVIDLDTVMPGSLLYDFGDAMRSGTNTAEEDEVNLDLVTCSLEFFESFTKGFLEELGDKITEKEVKLLPFSAKLLTFECGMRFLKDHIDGDTYFRIHHEGHNLERARNQFKLVADMEQKMPQLEAIVAKYMK